MACSVIGDSVCCKQDCEVTCRCWLLPGEASLELPWVWWEEFDNKPEEQIVGVWQRRVTGVQRTGHITESSEREWLCSRQYMYCKNGHVTHVWSVWPVASVAPTIPATEGYYIVQCACVRLRILVCLLGCWVHSCRCGVWTPVQSTLSPAASDDHTLCWKSRHLKHFAVKQN